MTNTKLETETTIVSESPRAAVECRFYGPTNSGRGSRIKVQRMESASQRATYGADQFALTVEWQDDLGLHGNYVHAVQQYMDRAGWSGRWLVALTGEGAVAVWAGSI